MTMSEHVWEVLERFELDLASPHEPARAVARWSRVSAATVVGAATASVLIGLSLVLLGLVLGSVAGIALAVVAYLLMVGSASVLYRAGSRARIAMARHVMARR